MALRRTSSLESFFARDRRPVWRALFARWWLILLTALSAAVGGLMRDVRAAPVFEASAVVAAVRTTIPVEDFELATTLFSSDRVLRPVVDQLGIDKTPGGLLAERYLDAEAVTGGLRITGRSQGRDEALALANLAAESFETAVEEEGLGTFAVFPAAQAVPAAGPSLTLRGFGYAALGALLGFAILLAMFLIRQPLLSEDDALRVFPADVVFSARVEIRRKLFGWRRARGRGRVIPPGLEAAIEREIGSREGADRSPVCYLAVQRQSDPAIRALLEELNVPAWSSTFTPSAGSAYWAQAVDESSFRLFQSAGAVVAVVSEGAPRPLLEELTEEVMVLAPPEIVRILIFVRTMSRVSARKSQLFRADLGLDRRDLGPKDARQRSETEHQQGA